MANKNVEEWFDRNSAAGLIGKVSVLTETQDGQLTDVRELGVPSGPLTKVPSDLFPYMAEVYTERDRMVAATVAASQEVLTKAPDPAVLRASCLELAIATVRRKHGLPTPMVDTANKVVENYDMIPDDLKPEWRGVMAERDRLWGVADEWWAKDTSQYRFYQSLAANNPTWTRGQLMNAVLIPIAVENVRAKLKEGVTDGK